MSFHLITSFPEDVFLPMIYRFAAVLASWHSLVWESVNHVVSIFDVSGLDLVCNFQATWSFLRAALQSLRQPIANIREVK